VFAIRRLDLKTDLMFARFDSELRDQGAYVVVRTPANPTFHWGNFLIFPSAPMRDDAARWNDSFLREFGHYPTLSHRAYSWDAGRVAPEVEAEFAARGVKLELNRVLTLSTIEELVRPAKFALDVDVRALRSDEDWKAAIENQIACRSEGFRREEYEPFKRRQFARYRKMVEAGRGQWFAAFAGGRLVADLGLFREDGVGRFQSVGTHPEFRRRGICGRLVHDVARIGLAEWNLETLVMVAADDYHAARVYESVGFAASAITEQLYCPKSV
jgi:ribosomal protein S18 acetylase RimI-like enzyme